MNKQWNPDRTSDGKPRIPLLNDFLSDALNDGEWALLEAGANVFQQNGRLVQLIHYNTQGDAEEVCTEESDLPLRRANGALVVDEVQPHRLTELLASAAKWERKDMRTRKWVSAKVPVEFARHLLARGQWRFRVIQGTVQAPTLRRDGSLLFKPGYDRRSRLFLDTGGLEFPSIAAKPSKDEAAAALALLVDVIKDFPFAPGEGEEWDAPTASRSVALSAMLTALVRRSIGTAPAHAVDAPVMGTGKTKISEIASVMATGHAPTCISQGSTQEEFQKRLFSVLLTGDAVVIIDNIEQDVESDEFCTVLTSEAWQSRVLGVSKMATVPTNTLFMLNGNRMTFKGDIVDRVIVCNIDARMEDPKARVFDREPVAYATEHRAELVVAGLTVMRAHAAAGYPGTVNLVPSRFPDWDRMVRAALVWLGQPDPQLTRERVVAIDPVREKHTALMAAWREAIGLNVRVTAQEVIARAEVGPFELEKFKWPYETVWPEEAAMALSSAIRDAASGPRGLNSKTLGNYLMKYDGRIYNDLTIRAKPDRKSASLYWLEVSNRGVSRV